MTTPRDLFVRQLRTMLWVELTLADEVLPELYEHLHSTDLRFDVDRHLLETEGHVRNLRLVFAELGERADPEPTPVLPALRAEHAALLSSIPADAGALRDLAHAGAIARTEHYEIASYDALVHLAKALGLGLHVVTLLREILEQEMHALEQVEHGLSKLLAERIEARASRALRIERTPRAGEVTARARASARQRPKTPTS
jgi:ferritin-like metal-binding protein YciE